LILHNRHVELGRIFQKSEKYTRDRWWETFSWPFTSHKVKKIYTIIRFHLCSFAITEKSCRTGGVWHWRMKYRLTMWITRRHVAFKTL